MSRIHGSRHWGVLALVGALGSFATTGCMAEQDVEGSPLGEAELALESARRADLPPWVQGGSQDHTAEIRSDAEIAGILRAANLAEIEYSQMACTSVESPEVLAFAEAMIDHHLEALAREGQLFYQNDIVPVESEQGSAFIAEVHSLFEGARNAQGADLDEQFMEGQVEFHFALLDMIDLVLLPAAENEALRAELVAVRTATLEHLEQAHDIYCELTGEDPWKEPDEPGLIDPDLYDRDLLTDRDGIDPDLYDRDLLTNRDGIDPDLYDRDLLTGDRIDPDLYDRDLLTGDRIDPDLYDRDLLTDSWLDPDLYDRDLLTDSWLDPDLYDRDLLSGVNIEGGQIGQYTGVQVMIDKGEWVELSED